MEKGDGLSYLCRNAINLDLISGQIYIYKNSAYEFVRSSGNALRTSYTFAPLTPGRNREIRLSTARVNRCVVSLDVSPQEDMEEEKFNLSAIRRVDGEREIYTASVPFAFVAQFFTPTTEGIPPEQRAQRLLDPKHAIAIRKYIQSDDDFYLPPMVAHIDGEVDFKPVGKNPNNGILVIGLDKLISSLDGQHRAQAIALLLVDPILREKYKNHRITVEFLVKLSLPQQQKVFLNLNDTAKGVSKSLCLQYADNSVDNTIAEVLASVPLFRDALVEKDKDTLTVKSEKAFVYKWLHKATARMKPGNGHEADFAFCSTFWNTLATTIPEWKWLSEGRISASELRQNYLCSHAIAIQAFAELGHMLKAGSLATNPSGLKKTLSRLENYLWDKDVFEGAIVKEGKVQSNAASVKWLVENMRSHMMGKEEVKPGDDDKSKR